MLKKLASFTNADCRNRAVLPKHAGKSPMRHSGLGAYECPLSLLGTPTIGLAGVGFRNLTKRRTSRTCPCCGHVSSDNRQTQAWFECVACGYENNAFRGSGPEAFLVGAINILARGIQLLRDEGQDTTDAAVGMRVGEPPVSARMACGSNCTGGRKQEPAETTAQGAIRA
ncbi:MAG: zinc ribbon domain-containing protein [Cyanobacteriota bacterium PSP.bin.10]|nr:zinc ribbon domain-containing protein [Cyanobacteriota bacterium PSP.bin.10]